MAGLIVPIAGRYTTVWTPPAAGGLTVGICDESGFELSATVKSESIDQTDAYGMSLLDFIYRGADWRERFRCKEYAAGVLAIMWPWGMGIQPFSPLMGVIGRRGSDIAGSLVMTATAGTPAASSPATLTAGLSVASPNSNFALNLTSRTREVPVEMVLLPYSSGGNVVWFTCT